MSDNLTSWVGKTRQTTDTITAAHSAKIAASLECNVTALKDGDDLPPGWHWCYFSEITPLSGIGRDGHQALGEFLPPVELPRRMWASGEITTAQPLRVGETVTKTSRILSVDEKQGRSGKLVFVSVRHEFTGDAGGSMNEVHQIVYREAPKKDASQPSPQMPDQQADVSHNKTASPVQLFRYSAVTFNSHRIHYDVDFCRDEEGYDGLIIHGPLTATMLMQLATEMAPEKLLSHFTFRALSPLTHIHDFAIHSKNSADGQLHLWATNHRGELAMTAMAEIS